MTRPRALARTLLVTGLVLAGPVTGTPAAGSPGAGVEPEVLTFDGLAPGETSYATTDLTTTATGGAVVVEAGVVGTGTLVAHVTTGVESCAVAWTDQGCAAGAEPVLDGWVAAREGGSRADVPVPPTGTVHLRVGVRVADDAPPGARAALTYRIALAGPDAAPAAPPGGPPTGRSPAGPPLAATGADVVALVAALAALLALGGALRRAPGRRVPR